MRRSTFVFGLEGAVSLQRLVAYRLAPGDPDTLLAARYLWNMALCESLYPVLSALEVSFRNRINEAARARFGTDWWFDPAHTGGIPILRPIEQRRVHDALRDLRLRFAPTSRQMTAGDIVAELTFGFWTALLGRDYERPRLFWPHLLSAVFPFASAPQRHRVALYQRFDRARRLRNRVFHHEPIWNRSDLTVLHSEIDETLGWLSPELRAVVGRHDRFPVVLGQGELPFEQDILALLATLPR